MGCKLEVVRVDDKLTKQEYEARQTPESKLVKVRSVYTQMTKLTSRTWTDWS
jgi:hypothetical protein